MLPFFRTFTFEDIGGVLVRVDIRREEALLLVEVASDDCQAAAGVGVTDPDGEETHDIHAIRAALADLSEDHAYTLASQLFGDMLQAEKQHAPTPVQ